MAALGPDQATSAELTAQLPPGRADLVGLVGTASYWTSTNAPLPLRRGASLAEGLTIRTGPDSALDLSLGPAAGIVRLTANTTVVLEKLLEPAATTPPRHVRLDLREGTLLSLGNTLAVTDRYEVKLPSGVAGLAGREVRVDARGYIVALSGKVLFAHTPPDGQTVVHTLVAPPAVYFSPHEGVRPAPRELEREVRSQCAARLKAR